MRASNIKSKGDETAIFACSNSVSFGYFLPILYAGFTVDAIEKTAAKNICPFESKVTISGTTNHKGRDVFFFLNGLSGSMILFCFHRSISAIAPALRATNFCVL